METPLVILWAGYSTYMHAMLFLYKDFSCVQPFYMSTSTSALDDLLRHFFTFLCPLYLPALWFDFSSVQMYILYESTIMISTYYYLQYTCNFIGPLLFALKKWVSRQLFVEISVVIVDSIFSPRAIAVYEFVCILLLLFLLFFL